ncbi:MAG: TRAP transporter substrate-binding protein DctP [Pseudomonadota bacterium]
MTIFKQLNIWTNHRLVVVGLLASLLMMPAAHAVTLKLATLSPEGSGWMKVLRKHAKNIEDRTNGEVKFKLYPGGVMGDDKAVLRKIRVGQLHGAVMTAGGLVQVFPDVVLYNLPLMFRSDAEVDYVRQHLDQEMMRRMEEKKFVGFGFAEVGFAYPMMQDPATSVGQLRGRKVWAPDNDPGALKAYQAFRISPIPLPIADVLAGLQTGLIDSIGSPPIGAIALQWHTQIQYALEVPLIYTYGVLAISERAFKKLDSAQQAIVREELGAAVETVNASSRADHISAKEAITRQGIEWLTPSETELAEWQKLADQASQDTVDDGYISADLYEQVQTLLNTFRSGG